jgi:hypothetical protein
MLSEALAPDINTPNYLFLEYCDKGLSSLELAAKKGGVL